MSKSTLICVILQEAISGETVQQCIKEYNASRAPSLAYHDTGRILTVHVLLRYFLLSAIIHSSGFRELHIQGRHYNLLKVDYSTLSKKASEVPYQIFLILCNHVLEEASRSLRRKMMPVMNRLMAAVDSTCLTAHKNKLTWAPFQRESSGVKYHVKLALDTKLPVQVVTSTIHTPDSEKVLDFADKEYILVCDRGYRSVEKMSKLDQEGQNFVIRLKDDIHLMNQQPVPIPHGEEYTDVLCTLGKHRDLKKEYRAHQFRVITFVGNKGKKVMLCTNIMDVPADVIAEMYRKRWNIECFFRELKQNFSIKKIFGTTENAVFSQGLIAFIAYVLTFCTYEGLKHKRLESMPFSKFLSLLRHDHLEVNLKSFRHVLHYLLP